MCIRDRSITAGNEDTDSDGTAALTIGANTGIITVADCDDIDAESGTGNSFTLTVQATDGVAPDTESITVTVTNTNPTVTDNDVSLAEAGATGAYGTVVDLATTGDQTGLTWSIASGNEDTDSDGTAAFTIAASTGIITVADGDDIDDESGTGNSFDLVVPVSYTHLTLPTN